MVEASTILKRQNQPTRRVHWLRAAVLALTVATFGLTLSSAQTLAAELPESGPTSDLEELAKTFIQRREKLLKVQTERDFWKQELEALTRFRTEKTLLHGFGDLTPDSQRQLLSLLDQNYSPYLAGVDTARQGLQDELTQARQDWLNIRGRLNQGRNQVFEATVQNAVAAQFAQVINADNKWLWFCAMMAGACLVGVYWFHHRQHYRRLFWVRKTSLGRRAFVLGLLILVPAIPTVMTFVFGNQGYDSLRARIGGQGAAPRQTMTAEIDDLTAEITKLEKPHQELETRHQAAQAAWLQAVMSRLPKGASTLPRQWIDSRTQVQESVVAAKLLAEFSKSLEQDLEQLQKVDLDVIKHRGAIDESEKKRRLAGGLLGATLLAVYGGLAFVFVRGVRRAQQLTETTCPRCLAVGKLEPLTNADGSAPRMGFEELRCSNVIRDDPFTECEFVFSATYSDRNKLGFPTLGVSASGKTHWLAMVYRELNRGRFPDKVHFEKVKGQAAREFDNFVDLILNSRIKMSATGANRFPHPLIFNFRDNDPFGKSDLMVSMFDYAGQVTIDESHFHRRRALDANGYFFFLDPTKPDETQVQALLGFREDLRLMKNLKAGQQIHIPVALCITKLDLLVNQPFAQGSDVIEQFYQDLSQLDQSSDVMTIELIQRRSDLIARLTETIWPGWKIVRQIRDLFGDRFMFFPMTPVGLDQPGVDDLTQRNIEPYGIIEPLIWLLHMNGYPVLNRDKVKPKS